MVEGKPARVSVGEATIDLERLSHLVWRFGMPGHPDYATQIRLRDDGRIGGYVNEAERRWEIRPGGIALLDQRGCATTVLDSGRIEDGRIVLEGAFVANPAVRHRLTQTEPIAHLPTSAEAVRLVAREGMTRRRNLVVMRAGERSLHRSWPRDIRPEDRSWDLALSWYGNPDGYPDDPDAQYHVTQDRFGKWITLWALHHEGSPIWDYDHVMFPDDDLDWSFSGVNTAFEVARDCNLALSQPSLAEGGHIIHEITRQRTGSVLRFTTFVEVMTPIFSREALAICAPTFGLSTAGCGIDHLWPKMLGQPRTGIAIIDATAVVHTRPPGVNYALGPAIEEGSAILDRYRAGEMILQYGGLSERFENMDQR